MLAEQRADPAPTAEVAAIPQHVSRHANHALVGVVCDFALQKPHRRGVELVVDGLVVVREDRRAALGPAVECEVDPRVATVKAMGTLEGVGSPWEVAEAQRVSRAPEEAVFDVVEAQPVARDRDHFRAEKPLSILVLLGCGVEQELDVGVVDVEPEREPTIVGGERVPERRWREIAKRTLGAPGRLVVAHRSEEIGGERQGIGVGTTDGIGVGTTDAIGVVAVSGVAGTVDV